MGIGADLLIRRSKLTRTNEYERFSSWYHALPMSHWKSLRKAVYRCVCGPDVLSLRRFYHGSLALRELRGSRHERYDFL